MMQNSSMSDQLKEAMTKKEGSKDSFTMTGQYTSTVMQEEGPSGESREYVMYDSPNGESIKVYGNWNEYAVTEDEDGQMMIGDEDYPIVKNEDGEYVLDEATFEGEMKGFEMGQKAQGGPGASKMEDLMQMLSQSRGEGGAPAPGMAMGGRIGGGGGEADSDDAVITDGKYSPFIKKYMKGGKVYENGGEIKHGRKRLTVSTSKYGGDRGTVVKPTFYADGEPVSPRQAAQIYKADYLKETNSKGAGAPDFNTFAQNAIMRSMSAKGQAGGMRGAVREQQREFQEDRRKAGVKGLLRGLSKYR